MKREGASLLIGFSIFFLIFGFGQAALNAPAQAGDAPRISMEQAVAKAREYVVRKHVRIDKQYLQAAIFHPSTSQANGRSWEIIWQMPKARGGTTTVYVLEDDTFRVAFGE